MTKLIFSIENAADKQLMLALGRRLNLPVEEVEVTILSEDAFWEIIDLIDPYKPETIDKTATEVLSDKTEAEIKSFANILSEKLFALDKQEYAEKLIEESYFSPDQFLDVRAFVVSQGRKFYDSILLHSGSEVKFDICEELVSLPAKAWKLKTGEEFDYLPVKSYFTYSNPDGWENTLVEQLLQK